jgi:subfamily B ATP-binding cassette protein MsbA
MLFGALVAALCQSVVALLGPWPLKLVFDNVLAKHPLPVWIKAYVGSGRQDVLLFAAVAGLLIASVGAICSYAEKHFTTTVGQWVAHDLRKMLYFRIQRLGLAYHDSKQTGDLISRVTSDIDSVQSFITSGMLTVLIESVTLLGMIAVMFYIDWRFTLIALSVAPVLFLVVFRYTRMIKRYSREVRKQEGGFVSMVEEDLSSLRVV